MTGHAPFGSDLFCVPQKCRVLYLEQELGERTLQERCAKIFAGVGKADQDQLYYVSKDPRLLLNSPEGRTMFRDLLDKVQPNVLVLDPISKFHTTDENNAAEITRLWNHIDRFLADFGGLGLSVVVSHHFGKPPRGRDMEFYDPLDPYNTRGSSRWYDEMDTLVTCQQMGPLKTPHKAWSLRTRWIGRHAALPDDLLLEVNRENMFEVRAAKPATASPRSL